MIRAAVLDDYQRVALECADWSALSGRALVERHVDHLSDEDDLVERLRGIEVVVLMRERTPLPRRVLERLPELRLVVTTGMGNASVDVGAAAERGVIVCGTALADTQTIELAWALIMAVMRDIPGEDRAVRAGRWQVGVGRELAGSTLGVLGFGGIGRRVAKLARVFDMSVLTWGRSLTTGTSPQDGVIAVGIDELFSRSDVVSVHLRLAAETRGIVDARRLALLGEQGRIVNTSRGPIVDEDALVNALVTGRIAGAALDVFDVEPLPAGHPLLSTPRTILSPHAGFVAEGAYRQMYEHAVADIAAWLDGTPIRVIAP